MPSKPSHAAGYGVNRAGSGLRPVTRSSAMAARMRSDMVFCGKSTGEISTAVASAPLALAEACRNCVALGSLAQADKASGNAIARTARMSTSSPVQPGACSRPSRGPLDAIPQLDYPDVRFLPDPSRWYRPEAIARQPHPELFRPGQDYRCPGMDTSSPRLRPSFGDRRTGLGKSCRVREQLVDFRPISDRSSGVCTNFGQSATARCGRFWATARTNFRDFIWKLRACSDGRARNGGLQPGANPVSAKPPTARHGQNWDVEIGD